MPLWVICAFLCLICKRGARAIIRGKHGLLRLLQCGLGMGGPAFPFLWNLAYAPLVTGLAMTLRIACPTYVDDLCELTVGPVQVMRLFLLPRRRQGGRTRHGRPQVLLAHGAVPPQSRRPGSSCPPRRR